MFIERASNLLLFFVFFFFGRELQGVKFTCLGLGDSNYIRFMAVPRNMRKKFTGLGAENLLLLVPQGACGVCLWRGLAHGLKNRPKED